MTGGAGVCYNHLYLREGLFFVRMFSHSNGRHEALPLREAITIRRDSAATEVPIL